MVNICGIFAIQIVKNRGEKMYADILDSIGYVKSADAAVGSAMEEELSRQ